MPFTVLCPVLFYFLLNMHTFRVPQSTLRNKLFARNVSDKVGVAETCLAEDEKQGPTQLTCISCC